MSKTSSNVTEFRNGKEVAKPISHELEPLTVVDLHRFLKMEIPPRLRLIDPWFPQQGLGMIYGWRGTGKTYMALSLAYAVASGGSLLDWSIPEPAKVVYIDGEMLAPTLQERLSLITAGADKAPEPGMFNLITPDLQSRPMPNLAVLGGLAALEQVIPKDTKLIIVDSLSSLVHSPEKENDAESWQSISEWAIGQRVAGRSVIFVHHAGKSGAQRGTSRREDLLDSTLVLKPVVGHSAHTGAKFEIKLEKSRSRCPEFEEIEAELVPSKGGGVEWIYKTLESSMGDKVYDLTDSGMKPWEVGKELGISKATVYRWLSKRAGAGVVSLPEV